MANTDVLIGMDPIYPDKVKHGQVYHATHKVDPYDSSADKRLSYMHRSFISFSFGGKQIEDFDLIAVTENNRLQRNASGPFEDLITTYDVIDGQFYWGTHFTNNQLDLVLATDGITEDKLDEFKHWFAGGITRELILAEHPNRAIMARVATPPVISMLPFEEETEVVIQDLKYTTSITIYRGNILLSFVMDEPFWYSKVNLLGKQKARNSEFWVDVWENANGETDVSIYDDKDALKIIKEDGVPVSTMLQIPLFLGNNVTVNPDFSITGNTTGTQTSAGSIKVGSIAVAGASSPSYEVGFIGPRITTINPAFSSSNVSLNAGEYYYLYYPGTAPEYPILSFSLTPIFNSEGYITSPRNKFTNSTHPYDTITLQGTSINTFSFTLPSIYYGYNQAINIFRTVNTNTPELRKLIRDKVTHPNVRAWAIKVVDTGLTGGSACAEMKRFFENTSGQVMEASFTINCKTGEATGLFGCQKLVNGVWQFTTTQTENVADMIRSNYLVIEGKDYFNERGQITINNVHKITHDSAAPLTHLFIEYKYRYY